jgi:hypothetical protein
MPARALKHASRGGQTLVMMALTGLLLAIALMGVINVYQGVKLKIEVQTAADTAAYSTALTEARTFNFFAISNRAMAAHFAGTMLLYSELSYVTAVDDSLRQAELAWNDVRNASNCSVFNPFCCVMRQVAGHVRSDRQRWQGLLHPVLHSALTNAESEWFGMDLAGRRHYHAGMALSDAQSVAFQKLEEIIEKRLVANSIRHKLDDPETGPQADPYGIRKSAHVWPSFETAHTQATWDALTKPVPPYNLPPVEVYPSNGMPGGPWSRQGINDISAGANGARYDWGTRQDFRLGSILTLAARLDMPHIDDPPTGNHVVSKEVWALLLTQRTNIGTVMGEAQSIKGNTALSAIRGQVRRGGNSFDGMSPRDEFSGAIGAYTDIPVVARGWTPLCSRTRTRTSQSAVRISGMLQSPLHQVHTGNGDGLPGTPLKHRFAQGPRDMFPISVYPSVAHFNPGPVWMNHLQNQPSAWVLMEAQPRGIGVGANGTEQRLPWQLRGRFGLGGTSGPGTEYDLGVTAGNRRGNTHEVGGEKSVGVMGALARGLVYYHRPPLNSPNGAQSWSERPNFMNPVWRAKLELYTTGGNQSGWSTARSILEQSGYQHTQDLATQIPPAL